MLRSNLILPAAASKTIGALEANDGRQLAMAVAWPAWRALMAFTIAAATLVFGVAIEFETRRRDAKW